MGSERLACLVGFWESSSFFDSLRLVPPPLRCARSSCHSFLCGMPVQLLFPSSFSPFRPFPLSLLCFFSHFRCSVFPSICQSIYADSSFLSIFLDQRVPTGAHPWGAKIRSSCSMDLSSYACNRRRWFIRRRPHPAHSFLPLLRSVDGFLCRYIAS